MAWRIVLTSGAKADIQEGINWYKSKQIGLGKRFHTEVKSSISHLKEAPFHAIKYNLVRCVQPHKFPYLIHYIIDEDSQTIIILGVLNTSMDPETNWFL